MVGAGQEHGAQLGQGQAPQPGLHWCGREQGRGACVWEGQEKLKSRHPHGSMPHATTAAPQTLVPMNRQQVTKSIQSILIDYSLVNTPAALTWNTRGRASTPRHAIITRTRGSMQLAFTCGVHVNYGSLPA